MRHFKLETTRETKEIYCDDFDDRNPMEYWFVYHNRPPEIFQKVNIISCQEIRHMSDTDLQPIREMGKAYQEMLRGKQLKGR